MIKLGNSGLAIVIVAVVALLITAFLINDSFTTLIQERDKALQERDDLSEGHREFVNDVFFQAEENCTAVTIVYYTNFSQNQQIISFSVPYAKYDAYHKLNHPYWGAQNLSSAMTYISSNETIINQIVQAVRSQTQSDEELANALLDFVHDKGHSLSIRYYPTTELKYPLETLVEMGGDCDTHSFLYGTLMKAAGFRTLILFSNETIEGQYHVATAVHLESPPQNSLTHNRDYNVTYSGETYYYAETTNTPFRIGDIPPKYDNVTFNIVPLES